MNTDIRKNLYPWLNSRPRLRQWLWFAGLWLGGLMSVFLVSMVIKTIMATG